MRFSPKFRRLKKFSIAKAFPEKNLEFQYNRLQWYFQKYLISAIQVSLAIRGGYVPENFQTANTKTDILGLI